MFDSANDASSQANAHSPTNDQPMTVVACNDFPLVWSTWTSLQAESAAARNST